MKAWWTISACAALVGVTACHRSPEAACERGDGEACARAAEACNPELHPPGDAARSLELLHLACERGVASACLRLGKIELGARPDEALEHLDRACRGGVLGACNDRASHLPDGAERAALFDRACAGGILLACANLGVLLVQGKGVARDDARALDLFQRACAADEPVGCANLANAYREGEGVAKSEDRAMELDDKACGLGLPGGCEHLAAAHLRKNDPVASVAALRRGCLAGAPSKSARPDRAGACWRLGLAYASGLGVAQDRTRARELYAEACGQRSPEACGSLGSLEREDGDFASALPHLTTACDAGGGAACNDLALMNALGLGVPKDESRAVSLFGKACDAGEMKACANLGSRHLLGDGAPKDEDRGRALLARACAGGIAEACVR